MTVNYSDVGLYPVADAARFIGAPKNMVFRWAKHLIIPSIEVSDPEARAIKGYSFEELVYLRIVRLFRQEDLTLEAAVGGLNHLLERAKRFGQHWSRYRIAVSMNRAWVKGPDDYELTHALGGGIGQRGEVKVLFPEGFAGLAHRVDALIVPPKFWPYVEIQPGIRDGFPVIKDYSIETALIRRMRLAGRSWADIEESYPILTIRQFKAADSFERHLDRAVA